MKQYSKLTAILILSFSLLVGCGAAKDEAISQSIKMVETTFTETKQKPNENASGFNYYLPEGFKVEEELKNNIILSKGKEEYILFVNPQEQPTSEVAYSEMNNAKDKEGIQSFKDDERFGYIIISSVKDKKYEVIVGIGGVKLTTITSTNDMVEKSKLMMEIANSVQYSKKSIE